jgi:hypothetical protein
MAYGVNFKEILGTDIHTIITGDALPLIHDGKAEFVHMDRIELANNLTIRQAQTSPSTPFSATRYECRRPTRFKTRILGSEIGYMGTPRTSQTRDLFFPLRNFYAQEIGDSLIHLLGIRSTQARIEFTLDESLGKGPTPGFGAGAAIGMGEHLLHFVDTRVFVDIQLTTRHCQNDSKRYAQRSHEKSC